MENLLSVLVSLSVNKPLGRIKEFHYLFGVPRIEKKRESRKADKYLFQHNRFLSSKKRDLG